MRLDNWLRERRVSMPQHTHRVTYRWTVPNHGLTFPALLRALADTGVMHADFEVEGQEASSIAMREQRIEDVHARTVQANITPGMSLDAFATSPRLCRRRNTPKAHPQDNHKA